MRNILLSAVLCGMLAACASTGPAHKAAVVDKSLNAPSAGAAQAQGVKNQGVSGNPLTNPNSILSQRSIYFDYNSDAIKNRYRPLIEAHAKYLMDHSNASVVLQGNTDERGSAEDNLALGERRATSVKNVMTLLGVPASQISTVSFGAEKPKALCHNESCWKQNRRVDIVYQGEQGD